jgi:hypothetical protein
VRLSWADDQILSAAVKEAKRHPAYRKHRSSLSSVAPDDVWHDPDSGAYMVSFRAGWRDEEELILAFAIASGTTEAGLISLSSDSSRHQATHLRDAAPTS